MSFHQYRINEIYSNADGSVQFIELHVGDFGSENLWQGHTLTVTQGALAHQFTFASNLALPTNNTSVLIATQGFADLGIVQPDFIVPAGFLFVDGGSIDFAGVDAVTYAALPGGVLSVDRNGVSATSSPTNFAGATGSVSDGSNSADAGDNALTGTDAADQMQGLGGNDTLTGAAGNDTLDGGAGTLDRVVYAGPASGYSLGLSAEGYITVTDTDVAALDEGTDTLIGIEQIQFGDAVMALARSDSASAEMQVNTYTNFIQDGPSVTRLIDGGHVVVWQSNGQLSNGLEVYQQRYSAAGERVGGETLVNTTIAGSQKLPSVAGLADGGWVVVWQNVQSITAQRYAADGSAVGDETTINTITTRNQSTPTVAALSDGGYVIAWEGVEETSTSTDVLIQRFDAQGARVGAESIANTFVTGIQSQPDVTALAEGGYVAVWQSLDQDGSFWGVYGQVFDGTGAKVGSEFRVNTYFSSYQRDAEVATLAGGGFVVTWSSDGQDGNMGGVYAQRFDALGAKVGAETRVNTTTFEVQSEPAIAALDDGSYIVTWTSRDGGDAEFGGVFSQLFDGATGDKIGVETRLNLTTLYNQGASTVAAGNDGEFVVWTSQVQDGSSYGVFARQFGAGSVTMQGSTDGDTLAWAGADAITFDGQAGNDALTGGSGADTLSGGAGADALNGGDGNDQLAGDDGNDLVYGGNGADVLGGGTGGDVLVGEAGNDTATGGTENDYLYLGDGDDVGNGDAGIDVFIAGSGNDTGNGGADTDYLYMGDGADVLNGDDGVDVLLGEGGNDTGHGGNDGDYFYLGDGDDLAFGDAGNDIVVDSVGNNTAIGGDGQDYFYMGLGSDSMAGGAGVDVMLGDAGNDTFDGGTDVDYLFLGPGGAGDNDTVIVDGTLSGPQVVYNFEAGGTNDVIRFTNTNFHSFADVQAAISDYTAAGNFMIITVDADTNVWLIGVQPSQLTSADFLFS